MKLFIDDIEVDVIRKKIKNIYLRITLSEGAVRISAPKSMSNEAIRQFTHSRLDWIRKHKKKISEQTGKLLPAPPKYQDNEYHKVWGESCLLKLVERDTVPSVHFEDLNLIMHIRPDSEIETRRKILDNWYRKELSQVIPELIESWERNMGVSVNDYGIKKMKTRWGTCNPKAKRIWLNLELAKHPFDCLEYIVVHEMVHLLEPSHNKVFVAYMNQYLPHWKQIKDILSKISLRQYL
jgi:predicted metal-dependent hydrolase